MTSLRKLIQQNRHKLVLYNETTTGHIYMSVFNYSQKYGGTFDSFKYYNDYVVDITK